MTRSLGMPAATSSWMSECRYLRDSRMPAVSSLSLASIEVMAAPRLVCVARVSKVHCALRPLTTACQGDLQYRTSQASGSHCSSFA